MTSSHNPPRKARSKLGSKRQVAPGVWDVRVSYGYKADGRTQRTVCKRVRGSEHDADRRIAEISAAMGRNPNLEDATTLRDYWEMVYHPASSPGPRCATTSPGSARWPRARCCATRTRGTAA